MHSNSTVFSLITIKGVPNMKKHLINLSQYWDQNRTQMKLLQQVIMSPVVTLSLIRYNSFSCSNFYFVMPVSRSRKNLGQFICCFPIIHAKSMLFLRYYSVRIHSFSLLFFDRYKLGSLLLKMPWKQDTKISR